MNEAKETPVPPWGEEDPLEEKMAPHSTIPAGRIPQSEKPDSPWGRKEQNIRLSLSKNCRYCFLTFTVAREKSEVRLLSFYKWLVFSGVLVDFFSLPFLIKKKN